ncbi:MAG: hypothetical protein ABGX16_24545 [Pirellulales bacterium]
MIDSRALSLDVTEYDWSMVNNVIYDNGVVIKSIPAIHLEQSASFILEWNGLTLAYSGNTLPNKWWIEHTKGVDFSIYECIFMPEMAMDKWSFSAAEALNAMTTVHVNPSFFGKVMAMTKPKHAVAYHFQNDADTLPSVMNAVENITTARWTTHKTSWCGTSRRRACEPGWRSPIRSRIQLLHSAKRRLQPVATDTKHPTRCCKAFLLR